MYLIYSFIYTIALLIILPFEYLKRPRDIRKRWLKERFGLLPFSSRPIWIHAVSVGEVIAVIPLIKKIKERYPDKDLLLSTVTDTGQKVAKERLGSIANIIYLPFDLRPFIKGALKKINPLLFIIMETELWPNIIRTMEEHRIPILLMNGRISERSFRGYKRVGFFLKDILKRIDIFCMQNELYSERIRALGAVKDRVIDIGSFKFDTKPPSSIPEWTGILHNKGLVIIAGSTHSAEEELILDIYLRLIKDFPKINLIIAPRHPERFIEVEGLIKDKGLKYLKRSEIVTSKNRLGSPCIETTGIVILIDTIGELASLYGASDIAIIGGSFIKHGGQNPLEPAYWGKAIVCGPHMENFPFIHDFYNEGGAIKADRDNLYEILRGLINSPERISDMGRIAKALYERNRGATERAIKIIERYL